MRKKDLRLAAALLWFVLAMGLTLAGNETKDSKAAVIGRNRKGRKGKGDAYEKIPASFRLYSVLPVLYFRVRRARSPIDSPMGNIQRDF